MDRASEPSEPGRAAPRRLGRYELLGKLATGGMAELHLARVSGLHGFEKRVVLKRILPQFASNEEFTTMFLNEARLAATLEHPNVAQVYDIGQADGAFFFTMEYVRGRDLRQILKAVKRRGGVLAVEHIVHVGTGAAAGLHHAHAAAGPDGSPLGIIHRDVSPPNVLVTFEGAVKIVDFGIAKAAAAGSGTTRGSLKGKIPYMSPEQCRGESLDQRSDIFSLGAVLWELTVGRRLFRAASEMEMIHLIAAGRVPPPSEERTDCPPRLEAIIMRALAAERDDRYATAHELRLELEDFAREERLAVSSAAMAESMDELFPPSDRSLTTSRASGGHASLSLSGDPGVSGSAAVPTLFSGSLEDMSVVDLVQTAEVGRKSGVIELRCAFGIAQIWCSGGQVIDAALGDLPAADAFFLTLLADVGEFKFDFCTVDRSVVFTMPTQHLLMEGMRRADEWRRDAEDLPPLETSVRLRGSGISQREHELSSSECAVLRSLGPGTSLAAVALRLEGDWPSRARSLTRWRALDLLEEVEPDPAVSAWGSAAEDQETVVTASPARTGPRILWVLAGAVASVGAAILVWSAAGPDPKDDDGARRVPAESQPAMSTAPTESPEAARTGKAEPAVTPDPAVPTDAEPADGAPATRADSGVGAKRPHRGDKPARKRSSKPKRAAANSNGREAKTVEKRAEPAEQKKTEKRPPWEDRGPGSVKNPFD